MPPADTPRAVTPGRPSQHLPPPCRPCFPRQASPATAIVPPHRRGCSSGTCRVRKPSRPGRQWGAGLEPTGAPRPLSSRGPRSPQLYNRDLPELFLSGPCTTLQGTTVPVDGKAKCPPAPGWPGLISAPRAHQAALTGHSSGTEPECPVPQPEWESRGRRQRREGGPGQRALSKQESLPQRDGDTIAVW